MFDFNLYDNPKPLKIFLCRPDTHKAICELNGIAEDTCRLKLAGNNQYELSFDYYRYMDINGERIETNGYDKLLIDTELFVEKFGYFKLKYPPYTDDGDKEMKSITAHSIDCELENKELVDFKVNTGEKDSAEYLVTYEDGETESLLNEYTGLPYDYIVFYNTFPEQLTAFRSFVLGSGTIDDATRNVTDATRIAKFMEMIKLIPRLFSKVVYDSTNDKHSLIEYMKIFYAQDGVTVEKIQYKRSVLCARIDELFTFYTKYRNQLSLLTLAIEKCNCNWSVGEIDSSLANKRFQFNVSENIYAFLTNDLASKTKAVVDFDRVNRKINVVLIKNLGNDSGVFLSKNSLINSVNINCNEEKLCTRYNVTGGNDIDLRYVNFGHSRIDNIDYYLSVRDDNGNLVYVSEELAEKYRQYKTDIEIAREKYIEYTKQYNQLNQDIWAFKYRLPNDEVKNDWDTFRLDELEGLKTVYNNLLCTLKTLYNEDYGDRGYTNGEINENFMRTTEYWYDYYAYKQVLDQLDEAINCKLNDERYSEIDNEQIIAKIKAFETEWSLYGTVELENKIKSYIERMNVMIDGGSIVIQANTDYTPKTWSNLSVEEKKNYNSLEINYYYTEYYKIYSEYVSCKTYLDSLYPQLTQMESDLADVTEDRNDLLKYVTLEGYNRNRLADLVDLDTITSETDYSFTATEIGIITSLYIDSNYSNENILTTSLDDTVNTVDVEKELLKDAKEELSKVSQPQLTITTSIDNLLAIPEFKGYNFDIYNYVMLEYYKDYYVKLRLYEIEFNPVMPEDEISVVFTNYINSASERSDLSYILQQSSGGGSSSGGSGGGSGGNFGESDDIDVTISNTMLAKLLNTEMFGSRVTDVVLKTINVKSLMAKAATFGDLINGTTTIDGSCISTGAIKSNNYDGTITTNSNGVKRYGLDNNTGSIIILEDKKINQNDRIRDGTFNLGGGQIVWDGLTLNINNYDNSGLVDTKISVSAKGIVTTVSASQDKYDTTPLTDRGLSVSLFGYGTPDDMGYVASEHNGEIYLNQNNGWVYISNTNLWGRYQTNGENLVLKRNYTSLQSQIQQTAGMIKSTVANSLNKYNLEDYDITLFGYGTPDDMGYVASGVNSNKYYLDQNNGWLYKSNGSIWSRYQVNGENVVLETNTSYLGSEIIQTAKNITQTVSASQDKYDTTPLTDRGLSVSLFGYGTPDDMGYVASGENDGKYYLDQESGDIYRSHNDDWERYQVSGTPVTLQKISTKLESQISINEDNISLKVSKDSIISEINLSEESATINANKINLNGYVTVSSLYSPGTTTIDGSKIHGGTISLGGNNNGNGIIRIYNSSGTEIGSWTKDGINATSGSFTGTVTATSGQIGNWEIDSSNKFLKGISQPNSVFWVTVTKSRVRTNLSDYLDKFGFTCHNSTTCPNFYYNIAKTDYGDGVYMIQEEISNDSSVQMGNEGVKTENSIYYLPSSNALVCYIKHLDTYYKVATSNIAIQGNVFHKGMLYQELTSNEILSLVLYADSLPTTGDYRFPYYDNAGTDNGTDIYIELNNNKYTNVLLAYDVESSTETKYTYLNPRYTNSKTSPVLGIGVPLVNGVPAYRSSNILLNSDGSALMSSLLVNDISARTNTLSISGKNVRLYSESGGGVYLGESGTNPVLSDQRLKTQYNIDVRYEDFFNQLTPVLYQYKSGHRKHIGFIAQQIETALNNSNISTEDFAGLVIDFDVEGFSESTTMDTNGMSEIYNLRYEEFTALNTYMIQKCLTEINNLKNEINQVK